MKRLLSLLCLLLPCVLMSAALNPKQQEVFNGISAYLTDNGYSPSKTSDVDLSFKAHEKTFFIHMNPIDEDPMYLLIYTVIESPSSYTLDQCLKAANSSNRLKAVKVVCKDSVISARIELFLTEVSQFTNSFERNMAMIERACDDFNSTLSDLPDSKSSSSSSEPVYLVVSDSPVPLMSFDGNGESRSMYVTTNDQSWLVTNLPSWCTLTSKSANSFTISCQKNPNSSSRSGSFSVGGRKLTTVNVFQPGNSNSSEAGNRKAIIKSVTVNNGIYHEQKKGVIIHVRLDVKNCKMESCLCTAYFHKLDNTPFICQDIDSDYASSDGHLCSSARFTPSSDEASFSDLQIFLPYSEIQGSNSSGSELCYFNIQVYDFACKSFIEDSTYKSSFNLTID